MTAPPVPDPVDARREPGGHDPLPLAGVRVLEFGYGVAAPVACRNLGEFGADVIRVESARRPDSLRTVGAGWVPLETDWGLLRDTGSALNFTCPGKRSIGLEIDSAAGREIFDRLVRRSDVLVMNMGVEAVGRLGLTYDRVREVNPKIIWMNMPSFGSEDGPYRSYRTWGRNIAAVAGLARLVGWADRDPAGMSVNFPDYVSALWGTVAVVCALLQRDLTGEGCEIDVAQDRAAIACIAPSVIEAALGGPGLGSLGNRSEAGAPQGVYPSRGVDQWVAVSVADDERWAGMCSLGAFAALGGDSRLATLAGRRLHHDELDEIIAAWSGPLTAWEAATELQAVGVARTRSRTTGAHLQTLSSEPATTFGCFPMPASAQSSPMARPWSFPGLQPASIGPPPPSARTPAPCCRSWPGWTTPRSRRP